MLRINTIFSSYKQIQSLLICATNSDLSNQIQVGVISNRRVIFLRGKTKPKVQLNSFAAFHTTLQHCCKVSKKELDFKAFENSEQKNKEAFFEAIRIYEHNFPNKKGHVEFIESSLKYLREFGVHEDLDTYKRLLNIMPKGPFVAKTKIQAGMMYFPKQQFAVLELLGKMQHHGVAPDKETSDIVKGIFGPRSKALEKLGKLVYWNVKFKNKSPWPLPKQVPNDQFLLGQLAVERITSVDVKTEISVYQTSELTESIDKTWIVSGQSPKQKELLQNHLPPAPVIVEGGDIIWLRNKFMNYFVLKADCEPFECKPPKDKDNLLDMESPYLNPHYKVEEEPRSVHEQDDGIIYAVCVTGTSSKDSLLSWVRLLQKNGNPILGEVPVLFRFKTGDRSLVPQSVYHTNQEVTSPA